MRQRPPHSNRNRLRIEPHQPRTSRQTTPDPPRQLRTTGIRQGTRQRTVDVLQSLIRLQEEIPAQPHIDQPTVHNLQIDHDQLPTGNLVLTAHRAPLKSTPTLPTTSPDDP
ncbi:hypothetical protein [Saccharopolyspora spinosa]